MSTGQGVEKPEDFGEKPSGQAERWKAEIKAFGKEREGWRKRVQAIERRYRDERDEKDEDRRFALLWANVEVLQPTLYAHDPKPEVARRFKDRDPVGRVMAMILERNLSVAIERDGLFGRSMQASVKDFLLAAQGTAWCRYDVTMDAQPVANDGPPMPVVKDERVLFDYVHWRDFGFTAGARTWNEVTAVWRRSFLDRAALVKRFGEKKGKAVPLNAKREGDDGDEKATETFAKAAIYEVWDSVDRKAIWVHMGMDELLDERGYPLKISGRFPCPAPLFGTLTNGSMTPVPDYVQYQDQARELDELTGRIAELTDALRLVGFTPGDMAAEVQRALDIKGEAQVIPLKSWAVNGGQAQNMQNLIVWLPIADVVKVLSELLNIRERVKADAYEITGLSDILRGSTQASETATAQRLKAQWGSVRVRVRQQDVQRFAAEALNIMAEVMVGHFDADRLAQAANVEALPQADQMLVIPALEALKGNQSLLHYRIDVETDSTVEADAAADKQAWTELLQGVSAFLGAAAPVLQGVAQMAPSAAPAFGAMLGEMLIGAVRRFKAGPQLETTIEAAFEALGQAGQQPPPGQAQPDPAEMAKQQVAGAKVEVERAKVGVAGAQVQAEQQRTQAEMAAAQDDSAHRHADRQMDVARMQHEQQLAAMQAAQRTMGPVQ